MTKAEAQREMLEADRLRGRISYRGVDFDSPSWEAQIRENEDTVEFREADRRFREAAAIVGDRGPRIPGL